VARASRALRASDTHTHTCRRLYNETWDAILGVVATKRSSRKRNSDDDDTRSDS